MAGYDVIVVGAGSNSLVAAAYLAKGGKKVLVLEKNAVCGGCVVSVEVAPGFICDPHASAYYTCANSPVLLHDELELQSRFGLRMLKWTAGFSTLFEDGEGLIAYTDLDRACADVAKFSEKDAEAYRSLAKFCSSLLPMLSRGAATPPLPFAPFVSMLEQSRIGRKLTDALFLSAYDVLEEIFESDEVKLHLYKWVAEAMECPETKGTALTLYNLFGLAHSNHAQIPVGGSRSIAKALTDCVQFHGGTIRTSAEVVRIEVKNGRARGVHLKSGEYLEARDAVMACIHPWRLGEMVPEIDPYIAESARRVKLSGYGAVNQQIALSEVPQLKGKDASRYFRDSLAVEYIKRDYPGTRRVFDEYRYRQIPRDHLSPLTVINSGLDPSRAPAGQCSMYLYHFAPLTLADGGLEAWRERKFEFADAVWEEFKRFTTNIDESKVIARLVESPLEHHEHSASLMNGDIFGVGHLAHQMLGRRPIPELAQYRVPGLPGLYLAGPFMHPGGTVHFGGRATAMVMYQDLGMELSAGFPFY